MSNPVALNKRSEFRRRKLRAVVRHHFFWKTETGEDVLHLGQARCCVTLYLQYLDPPGVVIYYDKVVLTSVETYVDSQFLPRSRGNWHRQQGLLGLTRFEYLTVFTCSHYAIGVSGYLWPPNRNLDSFEALRDDLGGYEPTSTISMRLERRFCPHPSASHH